MQLRTVLLLLGTLPAFGSAISSYTNSSSSSLNPTSSQTSSSSTTSSQTTTALVCCFLAQDTAHEVYWPITSYDTIVAEVNLISITTYITPYTNGTVTNKVTNTYLTNATFSTGFEQGRNPISFYDNDVPPFPVETATILTSNATAITTGGVVV